MFDSKYSAQTTDEILSHRNKTHCKLKLVKQRIILSAVITVIKLYNKLVSSIIFWSFISVVSLKVSKSVSRDQSRWLECISLASLY